MRRQDLSTVILETKAKVNAKLHPTRIVARPIARVTHGPSMAFKASRTGPKLRESPSVRSRSRHRSILSKMESIRGRSTTKELTSLTQTVAPKGLQMLDTQIIHTARTADTHPRQSKSIAPPNPCRVRDSRVAVAPLDNISSSCKVMCHRSTMMHAISIKCTR